MDLFSARARLSGDDDDDDGDDADDDDDDDAWTTITDSPDCVAKDSEGESVDNGRDSFGHDGIFWRPYH